MDGAEDDVRGTRARFDVLEHEFDLGDEVGGALGDRVEILHEKHYAFVLVDDTFGRGRGKLAALEFTSTPVAETNDDFREVFGVEFVDDAHELCSYFSTKNATRNVATKKRVSEGDEWSGVSTEYRVAGREVRRVVRRRAKDLAFDYVRVGLDHGLLGGGSTIFG